jgi:hypothetical protein
MKKSLLFVVAIAFLATFSQVLAQTPAPMQGPPKALMIVREDIKPGMMPAHNKHSASFANIFEKLQTPNHRIALVPVAGSENEVVYVTAVDSFKELEEILNTTDKKMSGVSGSMKVELDQLNKEAPLLHAGMRDMLAIYRPEMSFNPGVNVAQMRYFSITTVRVKPGHDAQYLDYVQKVVNVAREKAKLDNLHLATFQIISGGPAGTYMVFRPMKTLAEMDEPMGMKVRAAMSDDMRKDADKAVGDAVMSSETNTYWMTPNMSYVSKEFAAADPGFWHPKADMAVKPKPKKRAPKVAATAPPAN